MEINPTAEFIQDNFDSTVKLFPELKVSFDAEFLERYSLCPASSKKDYYSSFPGGLCFHNLNVLKWFANFSVATKENFKKSTLVKLAFLHNLGKVGTFDKDYYVPQESSWHRERGNYYEINQDIQFMKIPQRSLFLINEGGIKLTEEEYLAILLHDGQNESSNNSYKYKEPKLAIVFQNAVQWARAVEKNNITNWPK